MKNTPFAFSFRAFQLLITLILLSAASVSAQSMFRKVLDFDGDGKADYAVVRNENGTKVWYIWQSTAGFKAKKWGLGSDQVTAGDYDGDGKTDFAVYRELAQGGNPGASYTFHILQSQANSYVTATFTELMYNFNVPMHQDYDGDGKTDTAGHFGEFGFILPLKIRLSSLGNNQLQFSIPQFHSVSRLGDLDGDGRAEIAHSNISSSNTTLRLFNYDGSNIRDVNISNLAAGVFVPADFDGDGKGELAIWRESEGAWLWVRSSDGVFQKARFGSPGDIPVPADYDGDGKTDLAIWRPGTSQSYYWVKGSTAGLSIFAWGISTDKAVRY